MYYIIFRDSLGVFLSFCVWMKQKMHFMTLDPSIPQSFSYLYNIYIAFFRCTKRARLEGCFIFVPTKYYNTEATHQRGWMVRIVLFLYTIQPTWKRWLGNKRNFLSIFLLQICKIYILKTWSWVKLDSISLFNCKRVKNTLRGV